MKVFTSPILGIMLAARLANASKKHGLAFISSSPSRLSKRLAVSSSRLFSTTDDEAATATATTTATTNEINIECEWPTNKVRSTFIDYFQSKDHVVQPSSACAPLNDPTLLFTNAGMNQFKPIFLGQVDPTSPLASLTRATNSQKCMRAGGKHNDLEDVGRDTYHHTFFEMMGSWSFGDYFKKEAIDMAWELLTVVYKLPQDRLYATYFEGDEESGVEADLEARDYWLQYLPDDRIIASNAQDNFWEMGDTGPCGPCTEIHFDRIGGRNAASIVNQDDPNVLEIWNVVFIQYNRDAEKGLTPLPNQHVDTGMGLERLVSILQDKLSNYDIDSFQPLLTKIGEHSQVGPYTGLVGDADTTKKDTAYRAIADHARALTFAIADGAVPNNEGRGYVLRRILRRATRYGQQVLKAEPGFFATLVPVVVDTFGEAFPELIKNQDTILEIVQEEEQAFSTMLDRGIKFFDDLEGELKEAGKTEVSGDQAFYLYDTLGFPIDLTELMAAEAGLTIDSDGFLAKMEAQKNRSREARSAAKSGGSPILELQAEQTAWLSANGVGATDDSIKYELDSELPGTVLAMYNVDGFLVDGASAKEGDFLGIVMDKSSFYAEAGGQDADTGTMTIVNDDGDKVGQFTVNDVQSYGGFLLHTGVVEKGSIDVGSIAQCGVDYDRRRKLTPNHSMTHVLNAALREVLGDAVDQRGSLCNDEKLRFDFSHKKALTAKELKRVEEICQKVVADKLEVTDVTMPLEMAQALDGVRAVFGEVYPDPVRVVSVGGATSVEFCGGTHVANTAEAEEFVIVEETAVAKGIRRISAVTREVAKEAIAEGAKLETEIEEAESLNVADTADLDKQAGALRKSLDEAFISATLKAELRARIEVIQKKAVDAKKAALAGRVDRVLEEMKTTIQEAVDKNTKFLVLNVDIGADSKASQKVMNVVKSLAPDMAFMGVSEEDTGSGGKVMAFALVPDALVEEGCKADAWIRSALESCGGRGGGKPGNAQGQAKECDNVEEIFKDATSFAETMVKMPSS